MGDIDITDRLRATAGYHRAEGNERLADESEEAEREIVNLRLRLLHAYDREEQTPLEERAQTYYPRRRRRRWFGGRLP